MHTSAGITLEELRAADTLAAGASEQPRGCEDGSSASSKGRKRMIFDRVAWECILSSAEFNNELTRVTAGQSARLQAPKAGACTWITMLAKASKAIRYFTVAVHGNQPSWWLTQQLSLPTWRTQALLFAVSHGRCSAATAFMLGYDGILKGKGEIWVLSKWGELNPAHRIDFHPSDKWAGSRPGFSFKTGALGLGYYRDWAGVLPEVISHLRSRAGKSWLWGRAGLERIESIGWRGTGVERTARLSACVAGMHALYQICMQGEECAALVREQADVVDNVLKAYGLGEVARWHLSTDCQRGGEVAPLLADAMLKLASASPMHPVQLLADAGSVGQSSTNASAVTFCVTFRRCHGGGRARTVSRPRGEEEEEEERFFLACRHTFRGGGFF